MKMTPFAHNLGVGTTAEDIVFGVAVFVLVALLTAFSFRTEKAKPEARKTELRKAA
jgi:hypothetical protein